MISTIEMSGDRLVNIVVSYGTKTFSKPVRQSSACLGDVQFIAFAAGYATNNVRRGTCEIMPDCKMKVRTKKLTKKCKD